MTMNTKGRKWLW